MNILVTTLGTSWAIIPELTGFTNPDSYDFYSGSPEEFRIRGYRTQYGIDPVDEYWIITTNGQKVGENLVQLKEWAGSQQNLPVFRFFSYGTLLELNSADEITQMTDLIFRVVLKARSVLAGGHLYLSLAGGRKTMSADLQEAGDLFGCSAMIHVIDKGDLPPVLRNPQAASLAFPPGGDQSGNILPVVIRGRTNPNPVISAERPISDAEYPVCETMDAEPQTDLVNEIRQRLNKSGNYLLNAYVAMASSDYTGPFHALYQLSPEIIDSLKRYRIGIDPLKRMEEIAWLKKLPKSDLHCHLGGLLTPGESIRVAVEAIDHLPDLLADPVIRENTGLLDPAVSTKIKNLSDFDWKLNLLYLKAFQENPERLKQILYRDYSDPVRFCGIGIESYTRLGDIQGSSLLQTEWALRETCRILKDKCREENIIYHEIRCSPVNYTRGGLSAMQVYRILAGELQSEPTRFRILFIGTRHGKISQIAKHIELADEILLDEDDRFFAGFDLAGDEKAGRPSDLRGIFMPMLKNCLPITIHAGEDQEVENIWEAVYHLNADRIGHGLTLRDDPALMRRFRDRKIAVELCPSSNYQIVGFMDHQIDGCRSAARYPLKEYLDAGLRVTVNTDDPGISLTDLTHEFYKAACMTEGGLSKWDILRLVRHGLLAGFLPSDEKKQLIIRAEKQIIGLLLEEAC